MSTLRAGVVGLVLACGALGAPSAATSAAVRELAYEEVARRFEGTPPGQGVRGADLQRVLAEEFLALRLGRFEVRVPRSALAERRRGEQLRAACVALLRAQSRWLEWSDPEAGPRAPLARDVELLIDRVEDLDLDREGDGGALAVAPAAQDEAAAASERIAAALGDPTGSHPIRLVLLPTRARFVEFLCYCGWARPELRPFLWVAGAERWTHFFVDDLEVYALEYAAPGGGDYAAGMPMDARSETGLEQHVVQLATTKLLDRLYGDALPASFVGGLGNVLVIDLFGELSTRVDGDLSERQTQAREVFVPGGRPEGGALPPLDADSRWRLGGSGDCFVRVLRRAQKEGQGAKKAPGTRSSGRHANFLLRGRGERGEWVVSAPLLGPAAGSVARPPSTFHGDHAEFLRAYTGAFVHWLRTAAEGREKPSRERFARLLARLAEPDAPDLVAALEAVYGEPLSDAEASADCLEGRFLRWLAKRR